MKTFLVPTYFSKNAMFVAEYAANFQVDEMVATHKVLGMVNPLGAESNVDYI